MTLMLEPTQAVEVDAETQSIHAWSLEDDITEVVDYHPRSWKLPAIAVLAATAAITAGIFLAWPQSATKPLVAPTKPQVAAPSIAPPPQSLDQRFIALLKERNIVVVSPPLAVKAAHAVCEQAAQGVPDPVLAQELVNSTPGTNLRTEAIFVDTTREVYCP